ALLGRALASWVQRYGLWVIRCTSNRSTVRRRATCRPVCARGWLLRLGGGDQAVEGRVQVVVDDLLVGVRVVPVHDVAHAGGEGCGADEVRDQRLDLAVVEDHRVRPV